MQEQSHVIPSNIQKKQLWKYVSARQVFIKHRLSPQLTNLRCVAISQMIHYQPNSFKKGEYYFIHNTILYLSMPLTQTKLFFKTTFLVIEIKVWSHYAKAEAWKKWANSLCPAEQNKQYKSNSAIK